MSRSYSASTCDIRLLYDTNVSPTQAAASTPSVMYNAPSEPSGVTAHMITSTISMTNPITQKSMPSNMGTSVA